MSLGQDRVILVVNGRSYAKPFMKMAKEKGLGFCFSPQVLWDSPKKVALVVFTGGEDVSPELYGATKHSSTFSSRDRCWEETQIFEEAVKHGIPFAGICRGAQFLCVMAGGKLVQDITGHSGYHKLAVRMKGHSPKAVLVNSSHHQMQFPFNMPEEDYNIIGYMSEPRSQHYALDRENTVQAHQADAQLKSEPDIVYYPKIKALAAQYHPEWLSEDHEGYLLYQDLIDVYLRPLIHDEARARTA